MAKPLSFVPISNGVARFISQSALRIRDTYAVWDAERRYSVPETRVADPNQRNAEKCSKAS